ncbi:hypothetical protein B0T16DRAFT_28765 [Cercophora newfieldiana]|uniref:Uncharacterized protein n=1 Tax=Cercophora newfieldiana TaxID=92897 RepID=A0AA40D0T2_9PEZI|nr:hypothetical protein B0T16DRAFT_28765 [Cercophora newfieldiana]
MMTIVSCDDFAIYISPVGSYGKSKSHQLRNKRWRTRLSVHHSGKMLLPADTGRGQVPLGRKSFLTPQPELALDIHSVADHNFTPFLGRNPRTAKPVDIYLTTDIQATPQRGRRKGSTSHASTVGHHPPSDGVRETKESTLEAAAVVVSHRLPGSGESLEQRSFPPPVVGIPLPPPSLRTVQQARGILHDTQGKLLLGTNEPLPALIRFFSRVSSSCSDLELPRLLSLFSLSPCCSCHLGTLEISVSTL